MVLCSFLIFIELIENWLKMSPENTKVLKSECCDCDAEYKLKVTRGHCCVFVVFVMLTVLHGKYVLKRLWNNCSVCDQS